MKRIFSLVVAVIVAAQFNAKAQSAKFSVTEASYELSEPYKVVDAPVKNYFYKQDEMMAVKIRGKKVVIQKFNANTLELKSVQTYPDMPAGFLLEGLFEIGDKYYMFYSVYDRDAIAEQLFVREIDFAGGELSNEEKLLIKTDGKVSGSLVTSYGWAASVVDKFDFYRSFGDERILITYRKRPEVKSDARNNDVIGMFVFDSKLNDVWGDEVKMPYTEKKMDNVDYAVDKDGNAYVLAKIYKDNTTSERRRGDETPNYNMEVLRIPGNLKNVKTSDIDKVTIKLKDKFISSLLLFEGPDDYLLCAGYYNNGKDFGSADGLIQFKIGKTGEIFDEKSYEFPLELINQYESQRTQKRNEKMEKKGRGQFENLELRDLRLGTDGSVIFVGEVFYINVVTTYSRGGTQTTYYYHYDDMLISKVGADGQLEWMRKLPKSQVGTNSGRGGMSYAYMWDNQSQNHYIVFLDNVRNMELEMDKAPATHSNGAGGFLTAYKVTHDKGDVSKVSIFDTRNAKGIKVSQFNVDRMIKTGDGEFIVESYKKKKQDVLIKVKL